MEKPRDVKRVTKTLADGTKAEYLYHKASGARLPDLADPRFQDELAAARASIGQDRYRPASVGAVIAEYQSSAEFRQLAPGTQYVYRLHLDRLEPLLDVAIRDIKRRHILMIRDSLLDRPATANGFVGAVGALFRFALDRDYRDDFPVARIRRVKMGEYHRWSDAQVGYALDYLPEHLRRVVLLALYTGQRNSDLIRMRATDYEDGWIRVTQQKTKTSLWIPAHRDLRAEITTWDIPPFGHLLVSARDEPWKNPRTLSQMMRGALDRHAPLRGLHLHGLRKTASAKLAEAGCSAHEIRAITGHQSLAMIEHYTKEATQRTLAEAAIRRLEGNDRMTKIGMVRGEPAQDMPDRKPAGNRGNRGS